METDIPLYINPIATNNNPPVVSKKKWSTSSMKGLGSLEEGVEVVGSGGGGGGDLLSPGQIHNLSRGRRKSWHVGKFEINKKRHPKPVPVPAPAPALLDASLPPAGYHRQKRHSWWSILVPENIGSRTKSRSVDHGVSTPFESLRSKAEGRRQRADTDGDSGSRESLAERKMQPSVPVKTTTYKVEPSDTLTSVAARFDTTPSELVKLNRLASRTVFPGQHILVPDKSGKASEGDEDGDQASHTASTERSEHTDEEDILETLRVSSPKPGHVERVGTPSSPSLEKFLKINVRHITDGQGVVSGVLLVTPNAVMFDPNVSDPLVIDRGPESYGVIAPMEYVVNAAIYHDIAHMRVGSSQNRYDMPKPEVYRMKSEESEGEGESTCPPTINQGDSTTESREPSTKDTFPDLRSSTEEEDTYWREGDAFPKAFERDLVTPTNVASDKLSDTQETGEEKSSEVAEESESIEEDGLAILRALDQRRKSCLDHHWAVPSNSVDKDKDSFDKDNTLPEQVEEDEGGEGGERRGSEGHLVKLSCHDSGIDIRDPPPPLPPPMPRKTVYSDADILLAGDGEFVPPVPVIPLQTSEDEKKKQSVSFSLDEEQKKEDDKQETKKNNMIKRLSYPLAWMEGITGRDEKDGSLPSSADSHPSHSSSVFSKVFSRRPSVGTFIRQQHTIGQFKPSPKLDYRSMVSVEDMPELFVSFDKLIPRPARSCEDPPLYLRLRMGKPKDTKIPKYTPIMSYGKKKMRPEYWFSVPRERVDELYRFLMAWVGHLYGDLDEEVVASRGYELVDSDTELWDPEDTGTERRSSDGDMGDITRESWEVLSMSGELRRALYASSAVSFEIEPFIPDLVGNTEILTEEHRKQLSRHLPARAEGYVWTLVFSTSQHGFSLNSMYRKMTKLESPILMVIQDTEKNVFGALTSCSLKVSDHFYGTGESLLFRFAPDCQVYNWTGENMYFIKGNNESLSIGAGDGKFGLWLDGDLNQGRTEPCSTYGNEPLTPQEDFVVKTIECWAFV